jgi:hypothetical protein
MPPPCQHEPLRVPAPGEPYVRGTHCPRCIHYLHNETYRRSCERKAGKESEAPVSLSETPASMPSAFRQVLNFTGALSRHVAAGCPRTPPDELARRQALCLACEHHREGRCKKCGCVLRAKQAWAGEKCPVGRW